MPKLLVVDDEPGIRSLLTIVFIKAGFDVKTAADPFEAMALCKAEPFDLILSDVQMPGMDGHCLVRWLTENHPSIRPVLMSACDIQCDNCPYEEQCRLLRKPFLPSAALAAVTEALAS